MSALSKITVSVLLVLCVFGSLNAQRAYKPHSVLASGVWYKIAVSAEGVYKLDAAFLSSLGFSGGIPSAQLRLYGKTTAMLPESNSAAYSDDLEEVALQVVDGGDGSISGSDYALFYSKGPHEWVRDTVNNRFIHKKNLYSDKV
jgi:hypothetical protein